MPGRPDNADHGRGHKPIEAERIQFGGRYPRQPTSSKIAKMKNIGRAINTVLRNSPRENPDTMAREVKTSTPKVRSIKIGTAKKLIPYHWRFCLNVGLWPRSAQSRVTTRMTNDMSIGATPQRMKPRPGFDGLPPNNGLRKATPLTRTEKRATRQMVLCFSRVFMFR